VLARSTNSGDDDNSEEGTESAHKPFSVWGDFFAGGSEVSQMAAKLQQFQLGEEEIEEVAAVRAGMQVRW